MAKLALYRAWRPLFFRDVVAQEPITRTLTRQIEAGRVAHAYLFCGSRGTGKTTCAKIFARAVNCEHPENGDACGHCPTCLAMVGEQCMDILEIDAASNNGVDEIRALRDKVNYPPSVGKYRVYIIDEVHMLSQGAFNALLKTLEEPPAHAIFILATTEPQKLPATILSRCQRYDFRRIPVSALLTRLQAVADAEGAAVSGKALLRIALAAEGAMRDALSLLDMCLSYGENTVDEALVERVLGASDGAFLFSFAGALLEGDAITAIHLIDRLLKDGLEVARFARDVSQHLRSLLLAQVMGDGLAALLEIAPEEAATLKTQSADVSRTRLLAMLDLFLDAEFDMKWSAQPRIALEATAVRACQGESAAPAPALTPPPAPKKTATPSTAKPVPVAANPWQAALSSLSGDPAIFAMAKQAQFEGIDGDTVRLSLSTENDLYRTLLLGDTRRTVLEAALTRVTGRPMQVTILPQEVKEKPPAPQKTAQKVFELFGRENVQVVDGQ